MKNEGVSCLAVKLTKLVKKKKKKKISNLNICHEYKIMKTTTLKQLASRIIF